MKLHTKKHIVLLDLDNMKITLDDGREFSLIPIPAKKEEKNDFRRQFI